MKPTVVTHEETLALYTEFLEELNSPKEKWVEIENEEGYKIWNKPHPNAPSTFIS
jgi:hypothetical protein